MPVTYTSGTTLSFQDVMFTFEDMITGSQISETEPPSSTVYTIEKNGFVNKFIGTNLVYTEINGNTFITGGTIQESRLEDADGNLLGSLSDLNLPAQDVTDALIAEATGTDPFALENLFFNQNWTINGADGIDNVFSAAQNSEDGQAFGFTGNDRAFLGDGNDFVNLGAGRDRIFGGEGDDTLIGGEGRDVLRGDEGNDSLFGGLRADNLRGGAGDDLLDGGFGDDVLRGQSGNDTLEGDQGMDRLYGNSGNDVLLGGEDTDQLYGGGNNDTLFGGSQDDNLFGGGGRDDLFGGTGDDTLTAGGGQDTLSGDEGNDSLFGGNGSDALFGGTENDILMAGTGNDTLNGDAGNDTLFGEDGNDRLFGGSESDILVGGDGDDTLNGGTEGDVLTGGAGADTFAFNSGDANDVINDFDITTDTLTINGEALFQDGTFGNQTLEDGTEVTVLPFTDAFILGLNDGYQVTYGEDDSIFVEADLMI